MMCYTANFDNNVRCTDTNPNIPVYGKNAISIQMVIHICHSTTSIEQTYAYINQISNFINQWICKIPWLTLNIYKIVQAEKSSIIKSCNIRLVDYLVRSQSVELLSDKLLNIWLVDLDSNISAYSTYPWDTHAKIDGIVININNGELHESILHQLYHWLGINRCINVDSDNIGIEDLHHIWWCLFTYRSNYISAAFENQPRIVNILPQHIHVNFEKWRSNEYIDEIIFMHNNIEQDNVLIKSQTLLCKMYGQIKIIFKNIDYGSKLCFSFHVRSQNENTCIWISMRNELKRIRIPLSTTTRKYNLTLAENVNQHVIIIGTDGTDFTYSEFYNLMITNLKYDSEQIFTQKRRSITNHLSKIFS